MLKLKKSINNSGSVTIKSDFFINGEISFSNASFMNEENTHKKDDLFLFIY